MKKIKFKKVDAFTDGRSSGNPAGYIFVDNEDPLTENEMQTIAKELKGFVNEVGFVRQVGEDTHLRFYSSECEVAFCGHATIAIVYDLFSGGYYKPDVKEVSIHVKSGELTVFNKIRDENAVFITAPKPIFKPCRLSPEMVSAILQIKTEEIDIGRPIRIIDGGLRTLIVPVLHLDSCLKIQPNQESLRLFCLEHDLDIVHVATQETCLDDTLYRTRVFAPRFGYLEDPATGSGNAAFGYYLLDQGYWQGDFTLEQGPELTNPNLVKLKGFKKDGELYVQFGGSAITRIEGHYFLHTEG